ncbi:Rab9 effector protein with kelch motifs, partial [Paragonimus westermani]
MPACSEGSKTWGTWHSLSALDCIDAPSARVGHNAHTWQPDKVVSQLRIVILGGANLAGTFDDVSLFDPVTRIWTKLTTPPEIPAPGLSRYEHTSALFNNEEILIFGGATREGPLSDMFSVRLTVDNTTEPQSNLWQLTYSSTEVDRATFKHDARTQHTSACLTELGQLLVFAGAGLGSRPVLDNQVHMYDIQKNCWSTVNLTGTNRPSERFGHLALYQPPTTKSGDTPQGLPRGRFYVHGGMAESAFFDDFFQLEFTKIDACGIHASWSQIEPSMDRNSMSSDLISTCAARHNRCILTECRTRVSLCVPRARAAHGGACVPQPTTHERFEVMIFVFGGVSEVGALNDMFCFHTGTNQWTEIELCCPVPKARLDFAYCLFTQIVDLTTDDAPNKLNSKTEKHVSS